MATVWCALSLKW